MKNEGSSQDRPYLLHFVTVEISANSHNPSAFTPDFLASKQIVPAGWIIKSARTSLAESVLRYENGVQWRMDPESLQIGQYIGGPFQEDYPIYKPAEAYLSNVSLPYRTLRLCYSASIKQENPTSWIAQRFLPSWLGDESEPKVFATIPTLFFEAVDALCQAEIRVGEYRDPTGESEPEELVVVNGAFEYGEPMDAPTLREAVSHWPEKQTFFISLLDRLLK